MFNFASKESVPGRPYVHMEIFRHDEKDLHEDDTLAGLTESGKKRAVKAGQKRLPSLNRGYVVASSRDRAAHSAILQFFGPLMPEIADYSFIELRKCLDGKLKERFGVDDRLNFCVETDAEFSDRFYGEYSKDLKVNDTLKFQLEESDNLILDLGRDANPKDVVKLKKIRQLKGYKKMAGDMAEFILDYVDRLGEWEEVYSQSGETFDSHELQIFCGSHSQNIECFLMRVVELREGREFLVRFLAALPHRKSFIAYSDGFSVNIFREEGRICLDVFFRQFVWRLRSEDLKLFVKERDEFVDELEVKLKLE